MRRQAGQARGGAGPAASLPFVHTSNRCGIGSEYRSDCAPGTGTRTRANAATCVAMSRSWPSAMSSGPPISETHAQLAAVKEGMVDLLKQLAERKEQ